MYYTSTGSRIDRTLYWACDHGDVVNVLSLYRYYTSKDLGSIVHSTGLVIMVMLLMLRNKLAWQSHNYKLLVKFQLF